jgi:GNAT superfamily N-acetyltransferase
MQEISVRKGTVVDFNKLAELDYDNTESKMFSIALENNKVSISEVELPELQTNKSSGYQHEIVKDIVPMLEQTNSIPLVAMVDGEQAAYLMAYWKNSPKGKALVLHGVLVSKAYLGLGVGTELLNSLIGIAKADNECKGIFAEMGTDKYSACKLLQKVGFVFSGAEAFVYSNEYPSKFSKETIYFCYRV